MKSVRRVFDPNKADLRGNPENVKDLIIPAQNGRFVALDNLSSIRPWLADALCRIATGGGLGCRELYTDDEEKLFCVQNPVMVTAIEELTKREDFLDHCLLIHLPHMPNTKRDYERELKTAYEKARPRILGALLKAVSAALKNWNDTKLERCRAWPTSRVGSRPPNPAWAGSRAISCGTTRPIAGRPIRRR